MKISPLIFFLCLQENICCGYSLERLREEGKGITAQSNLPLTRNFFLMGNIGFWQVWDMISNQPYISITLTFCQIFLNKSIQLPMNVYKIAGWVANSVEPDQMPQHAASDLGLHCLLRLVFPNMQSKYPNLIKSNPFRNPPRSDPEMLGTCASIHICPKYFDTLPYWRW